MAQTRPKNLNIAGHVVPFDGKPRFAEIEAFNAGLREGASTFTLVQHMAPVIINTRLRPSTPFELTPESIIDEDTALGIYEVAKSIQGAISGPKVLTSIEELTVMMEQSAKK